MNIYEINTKHIPTLFGRENCNAQTIFQLFEVFYGKSYNSTSTKDSNALEVINIWQHSLNFIFKENTAPDVLNLTFNNLPSDFPPNLQQFKELAGTCQKVIWQLQYEEEKNKRALEAPKIPKAQRIKNLQIINEKIKNIFMSKKF